MTFRRYITLIEQSQTLPPEDVAKVVRAEYSRSGYEDPEELNDGWCGFFADKIIAALGGGELAEVKHANGLTSHEFVLYGGRYYDAEDPDGVDDWHDLKYFRRKGVRTPRVVDRDSAHDYDDYDYENDDMIDESIGDIVPVLYHGTCEDSAEALLKHGWQPNAWGGGSNMGQRRYLYLSTGEEDARWFAEEKGCDVVLAITNVPLDHLIVDPEDGSYDSLEDELHSPMGLPGKVVLIKPLSADHFQRV